MAICIQCKDTVTDAVCPKCVDVKTREQNERHRQMLAAKSLEHLCDERAHALARYTELTEQIAFIRETLDVRVFRIMAPDVRRNLEAMAADRQRTQWCQSQRAQRPTDEWEAIEAEATALFGPPTFR